MDIQRARNLTTHRLHTEMGHVYEDLEYITGVNGIMTHQIPSILRGIEPWLREQITDARFWDGKHDPSHVGEIELRAMTGEELRAALRAARRRNENMAA